MPLGFRPATPDDEPFLRAMLYEAVYWRSIRTGTGPPFEEGMAAAGVGDSISDWGLRSGDTAVICESDSIPAGAVWYRFYDESNAIRGYVDERTPVIVIAVASEHRRRGIGTRLMNAIIDRARKSGIPRLSLMVSGDNPARALYDKCGFVVSAEAGDSYLMIRDV